MKTKIFPFLLLTLLAITSACEKVIDIDLDTAAPRLVVEASIDWDKNTNGSYQTIKLTTTTGFFSDNIPTVSGAIITVTHSNGTHFTFTESSQPGVYECFTFQPEINAVYTLEILLLGQVYTATEKLIDVPEIESISQTNEGGIFFGNQVEVTFYFQDNPNEDNYYLIKFQPEFTPLPSYSVLSDRFFQGNQMFGRYSDEDLASGQNLGITLYGISEQYYNYMSILLGLTGGGGGPFQTPPATVRGNIVNETNFNNFALGYFRLNALVQEDYVVE